MELLKNKLQAWNSECPPMRIACLRIKPPQEKYREMEKEVHFESRDHHT